MASPHIKRDLLELGKKLVEEGPVKTQPTSRRIRILFDGEYIVDTTSALYVWEHEYYPYYYVPFKSFHGALPSYSPIDKNSPYWTAKLTPHTRSTDRILVFGGNMGQRSEVLKNMVRFEFGAADAWFEEDVPIYVHPKDPFRRVDVLHSTRSLEVRVAGELVAKTNSSYHLYETGLPCRYYIPPTAVKRNILKESETTTACPYKGEANYYEVWLQGAKVEDLVWYYKTPTLECANIAGCLCFYHEREEVEIKLDGEVLKQPKTPWS
ncbi:DUF427-domain-containing protein [Annulohypoxylon bovei var. microspora]|nr:DUF427-domain-containing protein [Annulohypoxylon bovei var. microspora]